MRWGLFGLPEDDYTCNNGLCFFSFVADLGATEQCVVCRHKKRTAIDAAHRAGDDEIRIAQRFGVTKVALRKHAAHLAPETPQNEEKAPKIVPFRSLTRPLGTCAVCSHPGRAGIEASIAAGDTWTAIGRHHLVDAKAVREHAEGCLRGALRRVGGEADVRAAANARARCLTLVERVEVLIQQAEADEDVSWGDRAKLITAAKGTLELLGRFTGEIGPAAELVIVESPRWKRIEASIAAALAPYPEAAAAVAKALGDLEAAA